MPESRIIASNGIFVHQHNDYFDGWAKVGKLSDELPVLQDGIHLKISRIPHTTLLWLVDLFRRAAFEEESELLVAVYYSITKDHYMFLVPPQTGSVGGVDYGIFPPSPLGYNMIGDIHSHPGTTPAGHSWRDDEDEIEGPPGLHIVFGDLDAPFPSISCSAFIGGKRVRFDPREIFAPPPVRFDIDIEKAVFGERQHWKFRNPFGWIKPTLKFCARLITRTRFGGDWVE